VVVVEMLNFGVQEVMEVEMLNFGVDENEMMQFRNVSQVEKKFCGGGGNAKFWGGWE
jgi:hypothetical protein